MKILDAECERELSDSLDSPTFLVNNVVKPLKENYKTERELSDSLYRVLL